MGDLPATLERWFPVLFAVALGWMLIWVGLSFAYRKWKHKDVIAERPADAAFLETWTSGNSNRSFLAKIGGARNCLLVAVTQDSLIVRPHFPFNLLFLPQIFDLDHVIPRTHIRSVTAKTGLFGETAEVVFSVASEDTRTIELRLRQPQQFLQAVRPI